MPFKGGGISAIPDGSLIPFTGADSKKYFLVPNDDGVTTTSAPGTPGIPATPTVIAGNQQISITITAPDSDGGSIVTSYTIVITGTDSSTYTLTESAAGTYVKTGLTNDTVSYAAKVAARNSVGLGSYSADSSPVTPTLFTPDVISGLVHWYDAQNHASLGSPGNGDSVSAWADQSDSNADATLSTYAASNTAPLYAATGLNSLPALNFNGASGLDVVNEMGGHDMTVFVVAKPGSSPGSTAQGWYGTTYAMFSAEVPGVTTDWGTSFATDSSGSGSVVFLGGTGQPDDVCFSNGSGFNASNTAVIGTWVRDSGTGAMDAYINGAHHGTGTGASGAMTSPTHVGIGATSSLNSGAFANGSEAQAHAFIGEIIGYSGKLSTTDINKVLAYLANKWNLTVASVS